MEAQGARVVPLLVSDSNEVLLDKLDHLDGVLYPGGSGDYYDAGKFVLEEIIKRNQNGQFFPAWGTCLGYEFMSAYTAEAG